MTVPSGFRRGSKEEELERGSDAQERQELLRKMSQFPDDHRHVPDLFPVFSLGRMRAITRVRRVAMARGAGVGANGGAIFREGRIADPAVEFDVPGVPGSGEDS